MYYNFYVKFFFFSLVRIFDLCKMFDYPILLCIHPLNREYMHNRVGSSNYGPSPLSSRHGSQESLRHLNTMGSMSMLQTPTSSACRDQVSAAQKKKSIKSSLGRFFSKKEKVKLNKICWSKL